jgi:tyrosine-protein kinase Etk/Wzc
MSERMEKESYLKRQMGDVDLLLSNNDIRLWDFILELWHARWTIIVLTGLFGIGSIWYALSLPNQFRASAKVVLPQSGPTKGGDLVSKLSSIPLLGGSFSGDSKSQSFEVLQAHFFSKKNIWKVLRHFNFTQHYQFQSEFKTEIEQLFTERFNMLRDPMSGIVVLTYEDQEPKFAADVVNYCIEQLRVLSETTALTENRKKVKFLNKRINEVTKDLKQVEEELSKFMEKNKVLSLTSQVQATIQAAAKIHSEILLNQIRLKVRVEQGVSENHPTVRALKLEIDALEKQLKRMEKGGMALDNADGQSNLSTDGPVSYIDLKKLPSLQVQMERISRSKLLYTELFKVLAKEYELAKIESAKEQEFVEIIEPAHKPEKRFAPRRSMICIATTLFGFIFVTFGCLIRNRIHRLRPISEAV